MSHRGVKRHRGRAYGQLVGDAFTVGQRYIVGPDGGLVAMNQCPDCWANLLPPLSECEDADACAARRDAAFREGRVGVITGVFPAS